MAEMYIQSIGSGQDVIMLHGWGLHGGILSELAKRLAKENRVHLVDLPGHGYSRDMNSVFDLHTVSQQVEHAIEKINKPAVLIGWSLGGLVALSIALHKKVALSKLVLIASSPCFVTNNSWKTGMDGKVFNEFAIELQQDYQKTLQRFIALQTRGGDAASSSLRELKANLFSRGEPDVSALLGGLNVLQQTDLHEKLTELDIPVQLVAGEKDMLVSLQSIEYMAEHIDKVTKTVIPKAGHAPFISHPDVCAENIRQFIHG